VAALAAFSALCFFLVVGLLEFGGGAAVSSCSVGELHGSVASSVVAVGMGLVGLRLYFPLLPSMAPIFAGEEGGVRPLPERRRGWVLGLPAC
jgi:hypothetical protein